MDINGKLCFLWIIILSSLLRLSTGLVLSKARDEENYDCVPLCGFRRVDMLVGHVLFSGLPVDVGSVAVLCMFRHYLTSRAHREHHSWHNVLEKLPQRFGPVL